MADRIFQLVVQYDGTEFKGWQRQTEARTVQGELERVFSQLASTPTAVTGAGRTDSGVHARGQATHVFMAEKWTTDSVKRAANSLLPPDVRISDVYEMETGFHARYSALTRGYSYHIGTTEETLSPFSRRYKWYVRQNADFELLCAAAREIMGEHTFRAFAVRGTAPETDHHMCRIVRAEWTSSGSELRFEIEANRFLHHMVRFLVGTMIDVAIGRRSLESFRQLLTAKDNLDVSPPAPAHALFLDKVTYPQELYKRASL